MKKSDLKTGMRAETKNDDFHIYYKKGGKLIDERNNYEEIDNYNDNLENTINENFDIIKIYDIPKDDFIFSFFHKGDLLWERKEEKIILTLDNIEYSESTLRSIIKNSHKD